MSGPKNMNLHMEMVGDGVCVERPMSDEELESLALEVAYVEAMPTKRNEWAWAEATGEVQDNPFRAPAAVTSRTSSLTTKEFRKLYEGVAFAHWRFNTPLNAHAIIVWQLMKVDPAARAHVLGQYLHRARKWARSRCGGRRIPWGMHYIFVHENAPKWGLHSHVLMNIEHVHREEFKAWSQECLQQLTKRHVPRDAFRLVCPRVKTKEAAFTRSWGWFRYLTKQHDDGWEFIVRDEAGQSERKLLREVFRLRRAKTALSVPPMKLCGVSHTIGREAQAAAGFRSRFWSGKTDRPYDENEGGYERDQLIGSASI